MPVHKIRKKPTNVHAIFWAGDNFDEVKEFVGDYVFHEKDDAGSSYLFVYNTQENDWIHVPIGHYVIQGVAGEFYPCSVEVIEQTYDFVEVL